MPTLKQHIADERLHTIHRNWKYLTPLQRAYILIRAIIWSLPSIHDLLQYHRQRTLNRLTYRLYKGHWIK